MSTIITRIYETYGAALDAATELKKNRYAESSVSLISKAANREEGTADDTVAEIVKAGIPSDNVEPFAAYVAQGKSLLIVRAVFGAAAKAIEIADRYDPIATGVVRTSYPTEKISEIHPLSAMMGWPLLWNSSTPLSDFWKWPTLINNAAPFSSWLTFPTLKSGFTFGVPKLLKDPAVFSNAFHIPVLIRNRPSD
jgi:hypothetical protein